MSTQFMDELLNSHPNATNTGLTASNLCQQNLDKALKQKIDARKIAPPYTVQAMVEQIMGSATYTVLPDGRSTVCTITLKNGFSVFGISSFIDSNNFDSAFGEITAHKKAMIKVTDIASVLLTEYHYQQRKLIKQKNNGILRGEGQLFRHYSGVVYRLLKTGQNEADSSEVAVYQSTVDNEIYVRPIDEFYDKFTCLSDTDIEEAFLCRLQAEYDELALSYAQLEKQVSYGQPERMSDEEWNLLRSELLPMRELHEIRLKRLEAMRGRFNG